MSWLCRCINFFKIPFWLGWRYTRVAKGTRRNRFISFISTLSMVGIALGVMALIVVLSVMNGFQKEVRERMLSVVAHIEVVSTSNQGVNHWQSLASQLSKSPQVLASAPFIQGQGMLGFGDQIRGVMFRGIEFEHEKNVSALIEHIPAKTIQAFSQQSFGVLLGQGLARALGVREGDSVTLALANQNAGLLGALPRFKSLQVVGLVDTGHFEYDSTLVLLKMSDAAKLVQMDDAVSGVRLRVQNLDDAPMIARQIQRDLPADLYAADWSMNNRSWFAAVQTEKRMMFIILTLIIAVAAFNLVSMLVMTVTDKESQIAILRTLGFRAKQVMAVFMTQGCILGILGTLWGAGLGVLLSLSLGGVVSTVEAWFGFELLPRDVYLISNLPSDLRLKDVITVSVVSLVLAVVATVYPSYRAAKVDPARALRHE
jgi:lipoprotein-releasing system permease protein